MLEMLKGRKTYITAILMIAVGFAEMFGLDVVSGVDQSNAMLMVSTGFGFFFTRAGIEGK